MVTTSLDNILFRSIDRFTERPSIVDREEFAAHIEELLAVGVDHLAAEEFVEHFYQGNPQLGDARRPADVAAAVVAATKKRMQVYDFNLDRFEYVVLEEDDKVVVVSEMGAFSVENDDFVHTAISRAIVPQQHGVNRAQPPPDPKAYLVRKDGTLVALDVPKLAQALDRMALKQVSAPAVSTPAQRLSQFSPVKKAMSAEREAQLVREDARGRRPATPPPDLNAILALAKKKDSDEPPAGAKAAVFVLLPDGSLARPAVGAASRWQEMVSDWVVRAAFLALGQTRSTPASGADRFAIDSGKVVALVQGGRDGFPGTVGARAEGAGQAIAMGRSGDAPIRVLGDQDLALAISRGAVVVPGLTADFRGADRFWVQPESLILPSAEEKKRVSRDLLGLDGEPALVAANGPPARLGAITGDPWADWALTTGGSVDPEGLMLAANSREKTDLLARSGKGRALLAAMARADASGADIVVGPGGRELRLPGGEPVVAFRAPDGTFVLRRSVPALRMAELDRPDSGFELGDLEGFAPRALQMAPRAGSIPSTVFAALSLALERSAGAGGFKLPPLRIWANEDAVAAGERLPLDAGDPRRRSVMLMGAPSFGGGQVARMLLSLPYPNSSELHVGADLNDALHAMLTAPSVPSGAVLSDDAALSFAAPGAVRFTRAAGDGEFFDLESVHAQASGHARHAMLALQLPAVSPLLARGAPSIAGLPILLARALEDSSDFFASPGVPLPASIQRFALGAMPEFVFSAPAAADARRPAGIGEDEIVIPMPLWAQMGRGAMSATDQIMASRHLPQGHAPALGTYRLVIPSAAPFDFADGVSFGPGVVPVAGPTSLELVGNVGRGSLSAQEPGGRFTLGKVALDGGAFDAGPAAARREADADRPLAAALQGALRASDEAANRLPPIPAAGTSISSLSSALGAPGMSLVASPPKSAPAAAPSASSDESVPASTAGARRASAPAAGGSRLSSSGTASESLPSEGSGATAVRRAVAQTIENESRSSDAVRATQSATSRTQRLRRGDAISGLPPGAWSGHRRTDPGYQSWSYWRSTSGGPLSSYGGVPLATGLGRPAYPSLPTGLRFRYAAAPFWWSSSSRAVTSGDSSFDAWDGSSEATSRSPAAAQRALRAGLRAANSAATLWRSILVRAPSGGDSGSGSGGGFGDSDAGSMDLRWDSSASQLSSLAGRFDALDGAALVQGAASPADGQGSLEPGELAAAADNVAAAQRAVGPGPQSLYVAVDRAGRAGMVDPRSQVMKQVANIEMNIVAAVPPSPPSMETMADLAPAHRKASAPSAAADAGEASAPEGGDAQAMPASRIEGSVEAIAQRIYHRIRRRIASDRERFGG